MTIKESNSSSPKVAIVVLNWNGWRDTVECLESLSQITYRNFQIVVVDNGSTDESLGKIRQWASGNLQITSKYLQYEPKNKPFNIKIVTSQVNQGYSRGNNLGIKTALSDNDVKYILVLNNDTLVKKDFLQPLLDGFKNDDNIGLTGPRIIEYFSGKDWVSVSKNRIGLLKAIFLFSPIKVIITRTPLINLFVIKGKKPEKIYVTSGCCMLFKADALRNIGLFDETTFLGWEEYIIAEKLIKHGYSTYFIPESVIYHKVGSATTKMEPAYKGVAFLESEKYFQDKYRKLSLISRAMIFSVRLVSYSIMTLFNGSYRKEYFKMIKVAFSLVP